MARTASTRPHNRARSSGARPAVAVFDGKPRTSLSYHRDWVSNHCRGGATGGVWPRRHGANLEIGTMTGVRPFMVLLTSAALLGLFSLPGRAVAGPHDEELLKQMDQAKLTLSKAIETAETAAKGKAIAVHARIPKDSKEGEVVVDCVVGDKCMQVPVAIATGKAGKITEANAAERKHEHIGKAKDVLKALEDSKATLAKTIATAEESSKAKALAVTPKLEAGKLDLVVYCHHGDKSYNVTVDAKTGKATKTDEVKPEDKKPGDKKPDDKKGADKPADKPGGDKGEPKKQ